MENIDVTLSGDRAFVEKMYRMIMTDISEARNLQNIESLDVISKNEPPEEAERIIWVHRCSEMMHKIYMGSPFDIDASDIMRLFDAQGLQTIYCEKSVINRVLPYIQDGHTLWAELTAKGRQTIGVAAISAKQAADAKHAEPSPNNNPQQ